MSTTLVGSSSHGCFAMNKNEYLIGFSTVYIHNANDFIRSLTSHGFEPKLASIPYRNISQRCNVEALNVAL